MPPGAGFALACLIRTEAVVSDTIAALTLPLTLFSGVFFPIDVLPSALHAVCAVLPSTLMVDLARRDLGTVLQTRVGIEQELVDGTLTFVPIRDARLPARKLMLLSRSEKEMPDAASALGRLLMDMIERLRSVTGG